jgi:Ca2+/H+ antiporter
MELFHLIKMDPFELTYIVLYSYFNMTQIRHTNRIYNQKKEEEKETKKKKKNQNKTKNRALRLESKTQ